MFAASAEHSCIRPLFCSEIARTRGPVAQHEFLFSSWAKSLGLRRSSPPILAGSDIMSRLFSLSVGSPVTLCIVHVPDRSVLHILGAVCFSQFWLHSLQILHACTLITSIHTVLRMIFHFDFSKMVVHWQDVNGSALQCVDSFGELRVSWWTLRTSKTNNPIATVYSSLLFKGCKSFGNIYAN